MTRTGLNGWERKKVAMNYKKKMTKEHQTHFNGDSEPFSASAFKQLSSGSCIFAHARSNSIKLCAHFDAINSKPELKRDCIKQK
jgi:hypothetical protein